MSKPGKNQGDLQSLNQALVLRLIHRLRVCSRAELARRTGLTKASITGITQRLLNAGLVREVGLIGGAGGRRSIGLSLCQENYLCVGLRLTRRHIRGGLFDVGGEVYACEERAISPETTAEEALEQMRRIAARLLEEAQGRKVLGVGIAAPGPIITREGKNAYMSAFPGWESLSIPRALEKALGLPVLLEHDGVCCALAEWWSRPPGMESRLMLCVLAGQGIGAGILMDGVPIRGALGCAGEIGHMSLEPQGPRCDCGNFGCLEGYVSTLALERETALELARQPGHPLHGQPVDAREILSRVQAGDALCAGVFRRQARRLGEGLVSLINILNPDWIVITDELAACDRELRECVDQVLRERLSPRIYQEIQLVVRPGSRFQVVQAASALVLDRFLSDPELLSLSRE